MDIASIEYPTATLHLRIRKPRGYGLRIRLALIVLRIVNVVLPKQVKCEVTVDAA